jgi:hypothetical protein
MFSTWRDSSQLSRLIHTRAPRADKPFYVHLVLNTLLISSNDLSIYIGSVIKKKEKKIDSEDRFLYKYIAITIYYICKKEFLQDH